MLIKRVSSADDIEVTSGLAQAIWRQHYPAIIGNNQVEYMLQSMQSPQAISAQIKTGTEYYLLYLAREKLVNSSEAEAKNETEVETQNELQGRPEDDKADRPLKRKKQRTGTRPVGYFAVQMAANEAFISKLYVHESERGQGLGHAAFQHICSIARRRGARKLRLTVNKNNAGAAAAYEAWGFKKGKAVVTHIGDGYIMDDYEYTYQL